MNSEASANVHYRDLAGAVDPQSNTRSSTSFDEKGMFQ